MINHLKETTEGKNSLWKKKLDESEYKDGWRCSIFQKKQKNNSCDILRIHSSFKNIS